MTVIYSREEVHEIVKYNQRSDYLLWKTNESQAKGYGNDKTYDLQDLQELDESIVIQHLQLSNPKQVDKYINYTILFETLEQQFHRKVSSNIIYVSSKLISFKMKYFDTKI